MKRSWMKLGVLAIVLLLTASSVQAFDLICRSEEMIANSACDVAGAMRLIFDQNDQAIIRNWLYGADGVKTAADNNYVLIRVTMSGTDVATSIILPKLCKDIQGAVTAENVAGLDITVPHDGSLVRLTTIGVEVSDTHAAGGGGVGSSIGAEGTILSQNDAAAQAAADITAYVWGEGDPTQMQYFEIYITDFQVMTTGWDDRNNWPWIRVGQNDSIDPVIRDKTTICANVRDFSGNAKLIVSLNNEPKELTYTTSDNQIGHFLESPVNIVQCTKTETCPWGAETTTVELCPLVATGQTVTCRNYIECFTAQGQFPDSDLRFIVRTNGAANGSNDQAGIYLSALAITDRAGNSLGGVTYWQADGVTVGTPGCAFNARQARLDLAKAGNNLDQDGYARICIQYTVNPAQAVVNTKVRFWVSIGTLPCGTLLNTMTNGADLVECGRVPTCMYFPYVITGEVAGYQSGIAITNLAADVPANQMNVKFTLTDAAGTSYTYTKSDFTSKQFTTMLSGDFLGNFAGAAAGTGWLLVQADFNVDGYLFLYDSEVGFGAGQLPRVLNACGAYGVEAFK
jgi:hypothetical protein